MQRPPPLPHIVLFSSLYHQMYLPKCPLIDAITPHPTPTSFFCPHIDPAYPPHWNYVLLMTYTDRLAAIPSPSRSKHYHFPSERPPPLTSLWSLDDHLIYLCTHIHHAHSLKCSDPPPLYHRPPLPDTTRYSHHLSTPPSHTTRTQPTPSTCIPPSTHICPNPCSLVSYSLASSGTCPLPIPPPPLLPLPPPTW